MMEFEQATAKMEQFGREEAERKSKVRQMVDRVKQKLSRH